MSIENQGIYWEETSPLGAVHLIVEVNLSNKVTDTLESNTILLYWFQVKGNHTQNVSLN